MKILELRGGEQIYLTMSEGIAVDKAIVVQKGVHIPRLGLSLSPWDMRKVSTVFELVDKAVYLDNCGQLYVVENGAVRQYLGGHFRECPHITIEHLTPLETHKCLN